MQTLVEKICEKVGEDRIYPKLIRERLQLPARYPSVGIDMPINFPGPEIHTEIPLELILGYQTPQSLYAMYSFGVNDGPVTIGGWFEPLAGATIGPYPEPKMGFKPTNGWGYVVPDMSLGKGVGDIHGTFQVDRYDNVYDRHTTLQFPGSKKNIRLNEW